MHLEASVNIPQQCMKVASAWFSAIKIVGVKLSLHQNFPDKHLMLSETSVCYDKLI